MNLSPGSPPPRDARERDLLLRRVPEVVLLPELVEVRFAQEVLSRIPSGDHVARIAALANEPYLERLCAVLERTIARAESEANGGLTFVLRSLLHFVTALPPERHPLVVALYFVSLAEGNPAEQQPAAVAREMDDYESLLEPMT
jgi:hypothetical protein